MKPRRLMGCVLAALLLAGTTGCPDSRGGLMAAMKARVDAGLAVDAKITDQDKSEKKSIAERVLGAGIDMEILGQRIKAAFTAFVRREFDAPGDGMQSMLRFQFKGKSNLDVAIDGTAGPN